MAGNAELIKNYALDRTGRHRVTTNQLVAKPDIRDVAQSNAVDAPTIPKQESLKKEKKKALLATLGISVGIALLLVLVLKAKIIKL